MSRVPPLSDKIRDAHALIGPRVRRTPVIDVTRADLGLEPGPAVTLKLELLQHTGSFKPRGAFHRVLKAGVPAAGLVAASGGNHGLGVAHVGTTLGIDTEIFVPETIPAPKLERLRGFGVDVSLHGASYDEARQASEHRAAETGALVVHAYDHPDVVAGAGTTGLELAQQRSEIDTVLVAVGGGGLMAGLAAWFSGNVRVVAVEPHDCPTLAAAYATDGPTPVDVGGLAADSLGARQIGEIAFAVARETGVESVLVDESAIRAAQRLLWRELRIVAEPGGATALAALTSAAYVPHADERVAVLVCGGNTDPGSVAD